MERIKELCTWCDCQNIWNMDESGCFLRHSQVKEWPKKERKPKVAKNRSRKLLSLSSLVLMVGKLENQLSFGKAHTLDGFVKQMPLQNVTNFSKRKSLRQVNIMENILEEMNREMKMRSRSVILFMDNATVHPESLIGKYSNIKILSKNTTSRQQPLDAGIIDNFKVKYRKKLMRWVLARTADDRNTYEIANEIDVIQAIE